jgi:hypothetical protein
MGKLPPAAKAELWSTKPGVGEPLAINGTLTAGPAEGDAAAPTDGEAAGEAGLALGDAADSALGAVDAGSGLVGPLAVGTGKPQPAMSTTLVRSTWNLARIEPILPGHPTIVA